jgi:hypothetical protein
VRRGWAKLVTLLLQYGADRNGFFCSLARRCKQSNRALDPWGKLESTPDGSLCPGHKTALLMACARRSPNLEIIKSLLSAGASVHARCHDGRTALHLSATSGDSAIEIAKLLLAHGADVCALADDGSLPIHDALREGNLPLVQFLETNGGHGDSKNVIRKFSTDAELMQDLEANDNPMELPGQPRRTETGPIEEVPDRTYWPRDERDQFEVFDIIHDSLFRKQLHVGLVLEILDLGEYWIKRSTARAEYIIKSSDMYEQRIYLKSNKLQGRPRNPIQKVEFVIRSHDQGWSSFPNDHGSYNNSWTWFDLEIQAPTGRFLDFDDFGDQKLVVNVHARKETTEHRVNFGLHTLLGCPKWFD